MKKENLALAGLVVIIVVAVSAFLFLNYSGEIFEEESTGGAGINIGDCADVHYIGRYASNDTVFNSSYADVENKTGGTPVKVFVETDDTVQPPTNFSSYSQSPLGMVEGFTSQLVGKKEGDEFTTKTLTPKEAYGYKPKVGSIINFSYRGQEIKFKILDIQKNTSSENGTTTQYTLRDETHYKGETITAYPSWENATVITKINETLMWMKTTPTTEIGENFTWVSINPSARSQFTFPDDSSYISEMNDTVIKVTHNLEVGDKIIMGSMFGSINFTVEKIQNNKINASYTIPSTGNKTYREFNTTTTIQRNKTRSITQQFSTKSLSTLFRQIRMIKSDFNLSLSPYAGEDVYFELKIENVYNTS